MFDLFLQKFNSVVPLTAEEENMLKKYLSSRKIRKKQYLLQEGDSCRFVSFVEKGAMRCYSVDESGAEHIVQFALEGWLIADLYSFLTNEGSMYAIDALEDAELTLIGKAEHEELLLRFPKYETFIRIQITGAYIALQRRITSIHSQPIEERYKSFVASYPEIVQRVPQHMIASYMGYSPETLSRARKKIISG